MKKVAIVGLGWLGMPLAMTLAGYRQQNHIGWGGSGPHERYRELLAAPGT